MESNSAITRLIFCQATYAMEDVPSGFSSSELEDYHLSWTSLWHPCVLAKFGFLPESRRTDASGLDLENALVLVPLAAQKSLDTPLEERLSLGGNRVVHSGGRNRNEIVQAVLFGVELLSGVEQLRDTPEAEELAEDFCAFGFAVVQVQAMARKLRYSFNLDWIIVSDQLIQAAEHYQRSDWSESRRWLTAAYDSLSQERDRYCSQQGYLVHLVLTAPTTLGTSLSEELDNGIPTTLQASLQNLKQVATANPEAMAKIREGLGSKQLSIAGGFSVEKKLTYLTERSLHRIFRRAAQEATALNLPAPKVLLPFYPGIPGHLPTVARMHGFIGGVLAKFSEGTVPEKEHAKLKWQSSSESPALDTILGHVIDAKDPESLLGVGSAMAKQLDYHQVPTLILAHWPSRSSVVFRDLVRCMKNTPALGRWICADEYFETTSQPYWSDEFGTQHFPFPISREPKRIHAIQRGLIRLHQLQYRAERLLDAILCTRMAIDDQPVDWLQQVERVLDLLDQLGTQASDQLEHSELWDAGIETDLNRIEGEVGNWLARKLALPSGCLVFHPASHPRRHYFEDSVDVPPFGFTWLPSAPASDSLVDGVRHSDRGSNKAQAKPKLIDKFLGKRVGIAQPDGSLANEFLEVQVDPVKGHLRSLYVREQRGNRLSGMLALAMAPLEPNRKISETDLLPMQDVRMEVDNACATVGLVSVRGAFKSDAGNSNRGPEVAIHYRMRSGAKWIEVVIEGEGFRPEEHHPVWRMIWPNEASSLNAWSYGNRSKWLGPLQANVELIEIDDALTRICFATGGLSFHRRDGGNQLQTALPIAPDGTVRARFFLGLQWQRPWETAIDLFQKPWLIPCESPNRPEKAFNKTAWLAQSNHPNLRFSFLPLELIPPGTKGPDLKDAAEVVGEPSALLWVVECAGRSSTAKISLPKPLKGAWKVDFTGRNWDKIPCEGSDLQVAYHPWEKCAIAIEFI